MTETLSSRLDPVTVLAFLLTALFGGANAVAIRAGYAELAPFWGAALRFLPGALILIAAIIAMRAELPRGRALNGVLIYGFLNFGLFYVFAYWALIEVTAGMAMTVLATVPLLTLILGALQGVERFQSWSLAGAVIAAVGVAVIFKDSIGTVSASSLLALVGGALCIAEVSIVVKKFPPVNPVVENAIGMLIGGALLLALSLVLGEPRIVPTQLATLISLAYLILPGTIGLFVLFLFVLRRWTASATAYAMIIAPLFSILLGALILDEPVSGTFLAGGLMVVVGVYLGTFLRPSRQVAVTPKSGFH
jgi:drug/metabolite transporter (DMT)-like permease